jgi:hypothetical protein
VVFDSDDNKKVANRDKYDSIKGIGDLEGRRIREIGKKRKRN